ncbi:flagellar hook-length control protein FliK [Citricoccus sp. I39-566]|uniref:flagellar hook-length control protein FliK n=1 Tax=Citricoccus sp. I39-566 TaxID=3073268 RepID=UPI0037BF97F3
MSSMIPGPTPDPSRSPAGSGPAGSVSRGPSFADHLRDASTPTPARPAHGSASGGAASAGAADPAPADAATGPEPSSVLPEGFTPVREGREFTRPISFDAVVGTEPPADPTGSAESPAAANLQGPEHPAVQATIITGAGNPASTVFNPGKNPAHAGQGPSASAVVSGTPGVQTVPSAATGSGSGSAAAATAGPFSATGRTAGDPAAPSTAPVAASGTASATASSTPASQQSSSAGATTGSQSSATAPAAPITAAAVTPAAGTAATASAPTPSAESAAPAPAVRAWTVQQLSTPVVQVAGRAVALPDGTHLATVRISPEALGPVTLEATSRDGAIRLEITAATEAGRENLRVVLTELRRELAAAQPGATLDLSSGGKDAAPNGTGSSPGGRPGEGKDGEGAGVGHSGTGTDGPGAETPATGTERQPGGGDRDGNGTGGLDVYA